MRAHTCPSPGPSPFHCAHLGSRPRPHSVAAVPGFGITNVSASRMKRAWQKAVVKSILRQNVGWYDVSKPQELAGKQAEAVTNIHTALGPQVFMAFNGLGLAAAGFYIGFWRAPQVSAIVLACIPVLLCLIGCFFATLIGGAKVKTKAYSSLL